MKDKLKKLSAAQEKVEHELHALIAYSFPNVPPEEFVTAVMPMRFVEPLPEDVAAKIALHVGNAVAGGAAPVLMRVGFTVTSRSLLVLGAAFSTGDFVHSVLTNSPNREVLRKVHASAHHGVSPIPTAPTVRSCARYMQVLTTASLPSPQPQP